MFQYTPFFIIHLRETIDMWHDEIRAVHCNSISLRPASVYIIMSTEPKPLIRTIVFLAYSKSFSETGVKVVKHWWEL